MSFFKGAFAAKSNIQKAVNRILKNLVTNDVRVHFAVQFNKEDNNRTVLIQTKFFQFLKKALDWKDEDEIKSAVSRRWGKAKSETRKQMNKENNNNE